MSHPDYKSVHFVFFLRRSIIYECLLCTLAVKGSVGGSVDPPEAFGCSVICRVTYLQVMSRFQSKKLHSVICLIKLALTVSHISLHVHT